MKNLLIAAGTMLGLAITAIGSAAPQRLEVPEALTVLNAPAAVNKNAKTYIVQLSGEPILAYEGSIKGYQATKPGKGNKINPRARTSRNTLRTSKVSTTMPLLMWVARKYTATSTASTDSPPS